MSLPYEQALSLISYYSSDSRASSSKYSPTPHTVALVDSLGRCSGYTVRANRNLPPCPQSAMDGFAVHAADTTSATTEYPVRLKVLGKIAAGDEPPSMDSASIDGELGCWQIMTGASFPQGVDKQGRSFDSCIRVEAVLPDGPRPDSHPCPPFLPPTSKSSFAAFTASHILITSPIKPNTNLKPAGEDYAIGDMIVEAGQQIRAGHVMALASMGFTSVEVMEDGDSGMRADRRRVEGRDRKREMRGRIRVGIINTGKEVVLPSGSANGSNRIDPEPTASAFISDSKIYNSNGPYLLATLRSWGFQADLLQGGEDGDGSEGEVCGSDDPSAFEEIIRRAVRAESPADALRRDPSFHAPSAATDSPPLPPTPPHTSPITAQRPKYDLLISTGGVSTGVHDYVPSSIRNLGGKTIFHKVAIRPGHPVFFGSVPVSSGEMPTRGMAGGGDGDDGVEKGRGSIPFFGLPGNPIATAVCLRFLVAPLLKALTGDRSEGHLERPVAFARVLPAGWKPIQPIHSSLDQAQGDQPGCGVGESRSGDEYIRHHHHSIGQTATKAPITQRDKPAGSHTKPIHTRCYVPARLHWGSHAEIATAPASMGSGGLDLLPWVELLTRSASQASGFVKADCYVLLREGKDNWDAGEIVACLDMDV